jgi:hypothetical protein
LTQTTPPPTNPNTPQTVNNAKPTTESDATDSYGSRFYIALALIVGIIPVISVAQAQYTQTTQLAAIFSGWITTIVAFYFYGQSSAQAQTQIKAATQTAANSEQRAIQAEHKISNIKSMVAVHAAVQKSLAPEKVMATTAVSDEVIKNINELQQKD